jgi:arylsulfatase A
MVRVCINVLNGDSSRKDKNESFIHYTPRWGKLAHNRWVMNGEYKFYRDGGFYNTLKDPLEKEQISNPAENELKIKTRFEAILLEKEKEFPFDRNDTEFNPYNN